MLRSAIEGRGSLRASPAGDPARQQALRAAGGSAQLDDAQAQQLDDGRRRQEGIGDHALALECERGPDAPLDDGHEHGTGQRLGGVDVGEVVQQRHVDLSPARRARLLELARTRGFFVLDDGVYATMRFDGEPQRRLREGAPSHVIYVDSMSKTIGGGLRLGWIAAQGPMLERLVQLKVDADIRTSALPQHLAAAYLTGDRHTELLRGTLPVYRARRDALVTALEHHLGHDATWTVPPGGNHIWVTLRDAVDERALYVEALRAGATFLPGGAITVEKSSRTSMRLSFGLVEPALLDEGVRRLAVALREVRRRGRTGATGALS